MTDLLEYIDHFGSDLTVVNAARVSLARHKDIMDMDDANLIDYLIRNKHTSPTRHAVLSVRISISIFGGRWLLKHRVGMAIDDGEDFDQLEINEVSGRYVVFDETQAWEPALWRKGSRRIKQGSLPEGIDEQDRATMLYQAAIGQAFAVYRDLLALGVCKEQARAVLPMGTMTQMVVTGSIQAWWHFYVLRADSHAQTEIRPYAHAINDLMMTHYPVTWDALRRHQ